MKQPYASVIIPAWNAARTLPETLAALETQECGQPFEVLVVDDGSQDETPELVGKMQSSSGVTLRLLRQENQGPAAARNNGAEEAAGAILVFTDADCRPHSDWLARMLAPFEDASVGGVKGVYESRQKEIAARFVQLEYEFKYRKMTKHAGIDFIDTYSAAFRRELFLKHGGYNTGFPVACAEDVEFSFRLRKSGVRMLFAPEAVVEHIHPDSVWSYFRKKVKFAYWRMAAVSLHPDFAVRDSHTPQTMKLQLVFLAALLVMAAGLPFAGLRTLYVLGMAGLAGGYVLSGLPFLTFLAGRDRVMLVAGLPLLIIRSLGQGIGIALRLLDRLLGRNRIGEPRRAGHKS